jgi:predicted flap endonuclease-1-like 5' DNA nuclease
VTAHRRRPSSGALREGGSVNVEDIEGIGPAYAQKLKEAGVGTVSALLENGATRALRDGLAETTGIAQKKILEWVNHADLMRVKGIGAEYSDLLEAAGVDSVAELAQRNAANLMQKLTETNTAKALVRALPTQEQVAGWIEQAKTLPRVVSH